MTMAEGILYYGSLRRFFENEWFVPASDIGIGYWEFWDMNPRILAVRNRAYERAVRRKDQDMWLMGQYIHTAFAVVLGNAFRKKGASPQEYPKKPLMASYFETLDDPEKNERIAMLEMDRYIALLAKEKTVPKSNMT